MTAPPPVQLPSLEEINKGTTEVRSTALKQAVSTLFEHSPVLDQHLIPHLATRTFTSYAELIDLSFGIIRSWPPPLRSSFISGHPRIGEQNPAQLSALSAAEQARQHTPRWVIERLGWLNAVYEGRYEGLRYITFVNGRTRREVMEEMEGRLGVGNALGPEWKEEEGEDFVTAVKVEAGGEEWLRELERAVGEVVLIAKDRARKLGLA